MRMRTVSVTLAAYLSLCGIAAGQEERRIDPGTPLNPLASLPVESVRAFTERPLFSPSRRKPQIGDAAEETPIVAASSKLDAKLLGITSSPSGSVARIAGADGVGHALQRGDVFDGWAVSRIGSTTITFSKDGDETTLALFAKDDGAGMVVDQPDDGTTSSPKSGIVFEPADSADPIPPARIIKQN